MPNKTHAMPDKRPEGNGEPATAERRRRYARSALASPPPLLTPTKWQMLRYLAELRFLSLPQLARLCCPAERRELSEKAARRHLRSLFDAGLVDVLPVSRAALAPPDAENDASLLHGSAPNVYAPTKEGLRLLVRAGHAEEDLAGRPAPTYGPRNALFLAHELLVRDVRVWLEECARKNGHTVERWVDGEAAAIPLGGSVTPRFVRPDAWFAYRMGKVVLVGLVEVDRGTERGDKRWGEKLDAYEDLFANRPALAAATGYINARVLVLCPDERRRDTLADLIDRDADPVMMGRIWLVVRDVLDHPHLVTPLWRRAGGQQLEPLLPNGTLGWAE